MPPQPERLAHPTPHRRTSPDTLPAQRAHHARLPTPNGLSDRARPHIAAVSRTRTPAPQSYANSAHPTRATAAHALHLRAIAYCARVRHYPIAPQQQPAHALATVRTLA